MPKMLWLVLLGAALFLNACTVKIPDIKACSGVSDFPGVAALCQNSNSDVRERLTVTQWLDFLYARGEIPDPKNPGKMLAKKGPAVCISSEDYQLNDTALAQLCVKAHCTYEQKKALERVSNFMKAVNLPKK